MAQLGKYIELYLMDGSPAGRWQVTLSNWNCSAFKIQRADLKRCDNDPEMKEYINQAFIFFLEKMMNPIGNLYTLVKVIML